MRSCNFRWKCDCKPQFYRHGWLVARRQSVRLSNEGVKYEGKASYHHHKEEKHISAAKCAAENYGCYPFQFHISIRFCITHFQLTVCLHLCDLFSAIKVCKEIRMGSLQVSDYNIIKMHEIRAVIVSKKANTRTAMLPVYMSVIMLFPHPMSPRTLAHAEVMRAGKNLHL